MRESIVCIINSYEEKYFIGEEFKKLPLLVLDELKQILFELVYKNSGIIILKFLDGDLIFEVQTESEDFFFDEIGMELDIKKVRTENEELFRNIELFYKIFVCKENIEIY